MPGTNPELALEMPEGSSFGRKQESSMAPGWDFARLRDELPTYEDLRFMELRELYRVVSESWKGARRLRETWRPAGLSAT